MKRLILVALACLIPVGAAAQTFDCPAGSPATLSPGPSFVPTYDCRGWVPANHPAAKQPITTTVTRGEIPSPNLVTQDIATALEFPRSGQTYRSVTTISGWALDCALGSFPPVIRIVETKPDGSLREIPNTSFYTPNIQRGDVQAAYSGACPAVYNSPLGANAGFGWTLPVTAITEPGTHTITVTFAWPAQNHAGSASASFVIQ